MPDDHGLFHHEVGAPHVLEVVDVAPADAHGAYLVWFEKGEKGFIYLVYLRDNTEIIIL